MGYSPWGRKGSETIEWLTLKNAIHINNVSAEFSFSNCHRTVLEGKVEVWWSISNLIQEEANAYLNNNDKEWYLEI